MNRGVARHDKREHTQKKEEESFMSERGKNISAREGEGGAEKNCMEI